jgi:colanic acid/amylovoran biosynthesis protein
MHANIAALSSHVPTVAIAYSHMAPGIIRACGLERFTVPVETITEERLSELLSEAYLRRHELSDNPKSAVAEQRGRASRNIEMPIGIVTEKGLA